jgi:hypothetical protein
LVIAAIALVAIGVVLGIRDLASLTSSHPRPSHADAFVYGGIGCAGLSIAALISWLVQRARARTHSPS